ncbi:heavy metal-associated isoprenylated plant protein 33-like isoform X1 [Neltuma alba]|uniref:heavy metal-associated isoprenylated plant protein 33-like isoform X1 n=1 Tax=Neltuma alba TaxID=207710 RepID=UPI0010A40342|nr:heavy metal-associated isoprenylated plant protein 33-like isoform X1 [Prosopis alba]
MELNENLYLLCVDRKVVEVKVGLHCDDCIKKILKAIKKIQDIETYNVDTQLNKVTVTGNVTTEQVIRVLHKIGKNATAWDQFTSN